jgi:hypothetical protein
MGMGIRIRERLQGLGRNIGLFRKHRISKHWVGVLRSQGCAFLVILFLDRYPSCKATAQQDAYVLRQEPNRSLFQITSEDRF